MKLGSWTVDSIIARLERKYSCVLSVKGESD